MKRKQVSSVVVGLAWLVSLGVVFILGILSAFAFHLDPSSGGQNRSDLTYDQRDLVILVERFLDEPADVASLFSVTDDTAVPEQLELTLRAILRETDPEFRRLAAIRLVRGLPLRRIMGGIRFLQEIPPDPARDQLLRRFLEVWAMSDGRSAIAFATSLEQMRERQLAIRAVLRGWSLERPSDAWNWVVERAGETRRAEPLLEIILRNLGVTDRQTALRLIGTLPSENFQIQMSIVVFDQILQTESPRDTMVWLSELPQMSQGPTAAFLAEQWAGSEPDTAADWLSRSYPQEVDGIAEILRQWAYIRPEMAADWAWNNYAGQIRQEFLQIISEEWIANDGPTPLAEWLNERGPDPTLDGAIESLALATAPVDPATALVWAQSITDADTRSMLEIVIGQEWIRSAPAEAEQALPVVLQSESARAALLEPVYEEIEDPEIDDARVDEQAVPMDEENDEGLLPAQ